MDERCVRHQFEAAEDVCRTCGHDFCGECLVYSFGPRKAPYCLDCALAAAGVRSNAANRPMLTKREIKARHQEWISARSGDRVDASVHDLGSFDDIDRSDKVTADVPGRIGGGSDNWMTQGPESWLDERFGGTAERVSS